MRSKRNQELIINSESVEGRISTILAEYLPLSSSDIPYDSSISLGLESLALVSVILRIGDEFGVDVIDSAMEMNSVTTVGDLYSLVYKLSNLR